jgi:hypothetical protein
MLRGRNLKPIHMVTNQGLLVSVKMGLCKDQNDAVVPLF